MSPTPLAIESTDLVSPVTPDLILELHRRGPGYVIAYAGGVPWVIRSPETGVDDLRTPERVPVLCHYDRIARRIGDRPLTDLDADNIARDLGWTPEGSS